jgi:SRP-independent targeting protein 2/TMEM208
MMVQMADMRWCAAHACVVTAVPTYGSGGDLISGGGDLGLGGITAYYFDAIYLAIFFQITTVLSSKFWLVFLVVGGLIGQMHDKAVCCCAGHARNGVQHAQ